MHFKVTSCNHLSAQGTCWGQISASNDVLLPVPLCLTSQHQTTLWYITRFPSLGIKCYIALNIAHCMETYGYASNMRHVMRRDDRVPGLHVHLPNTAGQVSRTRGWRRWRWTEHKSSHPTPVAAWLIYKLWPFSPSFHCHWKKIRWGRLL